MKKLIAAIVVMVLGTAIRANQPLIPDYGGTTPSTTILNKKNGATSRPKMPAEQRIECTYANGFLTLEFWEPEGACHLEIRAIDTDKIIAFDFVSDFSPTIIETELPDGAEIMLTTEYGNCYSGSMPSR